MDLDQQVLFGLMRGLVVIILPQRDISALFEPCVAFCRIILPLLFVGCSGVVHRQESIFQCHHHSFRLIATMAFLTTVSKICNKNLVRNFTLAKFFACSKSFTPPFILFSSLLAQLWSKKPSVLINKKWP